MFKKTVVEIQIAEPRAWQNIAASLDDDDVMNFFFLKKQNGVKPIELHSNNQTEFIICTP